MAQLKDCTNSHLMAHTECKKEIACNVFKGDKCNEVRKECKDILIKRFNDNCQSELVKIEERCEKEVRQKFVEKKQGIEDVLEKTMESLSGICDLAPESCKGMKDEARKSLEIMYNKEMADKLIKCKHGEDHVKLGEHGKLYLKEAVKALYPELSDDIINKVESGTYFVRQFGLNIKNSDNGGTYDPITYTGNIDKSCLNIPHSNTIIESYSIKDNGTVQCRNQILNDVKRENTTLRDNDNIHIQIAKVANERSGVDKCKPVVTVSQKEPLIIANVANGKLVTKDNTVTNVTYDICKQFWGEKGRIFDCADTEEDCKVCQNSIWDFQGEIPVYAGGCQLL